MDREHFVVPGDRAKIVQLVTVLVALPMCFPAQESMSPRYETGNIILTLGAPERSFPQPQNPLREYAFGIAPWYRP